MSENGFERDEGLESVLEQLSAQLRMSLGNIHSALERLAPPEAREENGRLDRDAAVLSQSYYRILRLANNLSDAAGLEREMRPIPLQNDDVVVLVRNVVRQAEVPAELLDLTLSFHSEKPGHVAAVEPARLERLVLNLLSNAFKFTPRGGAVDVEVRGTAQRVELAVSDTGRGMDAGRMAQAFAAYKRPAAPEAGGQGMGLGLPICRRIAQEHGGTLVLTSAPGRGTTVTVSLPNRCIRGTCLGEPAYLPGGGHNPALVELSDALPWRAFTRHYAD